jgi:hypothetical protein
MKQGYLDMSKKVEMDKVIEDSKKRFLQMEVPKK